MPVKWNRHIHITNKHKSIYRFYLMLLNMLISFDSFGIFETFYLLNGEKSTDKLITYSPLFLTTIAVYKWIDTMQIYKLDLYKWIACHEWGNIKINSTISVGIPNAGTDLFQLHRIVHFIFRSLSIWKLKFIAFRVVFDERSCAGTQFYRYRSNDNGSTLLDRSIWNFMCYELTMCTTHFFGLTWLCYAFFGEKLSLQWLVESTVGFCIFLHLRYYISLRLFR